METCLTGSRLSSGVMPSSTVVWTAILLLSVTSELSRASNFEPRASVVVEPLGVRDGVDAGRGEVVAGEVEVEVGDAAAGL